MPQWFNLHTPKELKLEWGMHVETSALILLLILDIDHGRMFLNYLEFQGVKGGNFLKTGRFDSLLFLHYDL